MSYFVTPNTWCWNYGIEDKRVGHDSAPDRVSQGTAMPSAQGARGVADFATAALARPVGATALQTDDDN